MTVEHVVIFDLDGTLLSTEQLIIEVARIVLQKYNKELTNDMIAASMGKSPLGAWQSVVDMLDLAVPPQQLYDESEMELCGRWHEAKYLPGAYRVIKHLQKHGHRLALVTSTPRAAFKEKIQNKDLLKSCFEVVVCGDDPDLEKTKPAPDCFLKASKLMDVSPDACLVVEDSHSGVFAALAAGMKVVYVPSLPGSMDTSELTKGIPSPPRIEQHTTLLEFSPEAYGLTPFDDAISECIPLTVDGVWKISGHVVKGFGRGSKQLGIPTANIDTLSVSTSIPASVTGIFIGWARISKTSDTVYKMCCSIGYNPVFKNTEKSCEPWILHDFGDANFVGQPIQLLICGYIRPESSNFESLDHLIQRIHKDADIAREALDHASLLQYKSDPFFD